MIKTILVVAGLTATPLVAQEATCLKLQELAEVVAQARDDGVPESYVLSTVPPYSSEPIHIVTRHMINLAYHEGATMSPKTFGTLTYSTCMKRFSE